MLGTGRVSLLGVVLAGCGAANAARETLTVSQGFITFTGARYDDGRNKPYRLKFKQDDTRSLYMFDSASRVTDIKVGTERFEVLYDASNNLESVELTSSTRRALAQDENDAVAMEGRRLEFDDCIDCEDGWDALCAGVSSVCDLVDYGSPFTTTAGASIDTMCETFGSACSSFEASVACQYQCGGASIDACLDPTKQSYKCEFTGEYTMELTYCKLSDDDIAFLPACFEHFGKTNIEVLDLDESLFTTIPKGTFAGLSELKSLDLYGNDLVTLPEGVFSDLTKLVFLDLAWNDLVSLPEGTFSGLESLQILRLFNNELTPETLPIGLFSGLSQLQHLYLDGNDLEDLTSLVGLFDGLTELTELSFSDSGVRTVPEGLFVGLTKLEDLSFYMNGLTSLPEGVFSGLTSLLELELTSNNLSSLGSTLSGLTELLKLKLQYNCNLLLTEDTFSGLANLETLDLQYCGLTTLPAEIFSPMVNLVTLDLQENDDLQCLPSTTATSIDLPSDDFMAGTCECTPEEAVFCGDGLSCESGTAGYTCVAE